MNMIAIGTAGSWILIGVVVLTLWVFWAMLNWTFDLIDRAHERQRTSQLSQERQEARVRGDGSDF